MPEVADVYRLVAGCLPEELFDRQMQRSERGTQLTVGQQIWVRQMRHKSVVILMNGRAQKERPLPFELEDRARQEPCALMKEPLFAQAAGRRVAVAIEHREGLAVLEHAGPRIGQAGCRQQVIWSEIGGIHL